MKEFKNIGDAVKTFVKMRNELRDWMAKQKEEEARRKQELEEVEVWLLQKAGELGVDSFKTPYGTAYKNLREHYRIKDWGSFVEYVKETGNFQLFEKRVAKLAAKEIHRTEGEIPDGLDYSSEYVMGVLSPSKKGKGGEE